MPQARDEAGNIWEVDAQGSPVRLVQAAGQQQNQPPADPTFQYQGAQAQAELDRTLAQTGSANARAQVDSATVDSQIALANARAAEAQANANAAIAEQNAPDASRPEITSASFSEAMQGFTASMALTDTINALERRFEEGPGSTNGIAGLADYLPLASNERFDRAANAARGTVGDVLGFTGGQLNSAREAELNVGPYIPTAADKDSVIEDSIDRLRQLQEQGIQRSVAILGGVPDSAGNIQPIPEGAQLNAQTVQQMLYPDPMQNPGALDYLRTDGGRGEELGAAGFGADTEAIPAPPEMVREHDAIVAQMASENGGRIDPQAYAAARARLDQKYNRESDPEDVASWARTVNDYLDAGGRTIPTGITSERRTLNQTEVLRNNVVSNPLGAGFVGAANGASFGAVGAMAPDQAAALNDAYPLSSLSGEVLGSIGGTGAIGAIGRNTVGRVAPKLLGGGRRAQTARNVATDATYAGTYSGVSGDDVATGSTLGAGGSLLGQGLGRGLGAAVGGIQRSAPAQALIDRGVRLSVGRQLGDGASRFEDLMQSVPFVGGQVRARQNEAFQDFNQAAFAEAASPLDGFNPTAIGREGIEQFDDAVGQAYSGALAGRAVPVDGQFTDDLALAAASRNQLPDDLAARTDRLIENHTGPLQEAGQVTGDAYQRARRGLGRARNNAGQIAQEFDQPYRDTMTGVIDAYDGLLSRGGGADVIAGLNTANAANKNLRVLENASLDRAKIGTQTGDVNVFTPSQLLASARQSERKFNGNALTQLGEEGQAVLPSTVPNSGTADRVLATGALGTLGIGGVAGLGGGAGYAIGGQEGIDNGALTGAGLAGALALLGTRRGQQIMQQVAFERPDVAQQVGRAISGRRGLFGSAGARLALEAQ